MRDKEMRWYISHWMDRSVIIRLMIIDLIFCTIDFIQLVCWLSAHLSAQGAFVFSLHIVCFVVHIACQVDLIAYSLVLYLHFCSTLNKIVFFFQRICAWWTIEPTDMLTGWKDGWHVYKDAAGVIIEYFAWHVSMRRIDDTTVSAFVSLH